MFQVIVLAVMLGFGQQQGPKSLDIDPARVLPPVIVPAGTIIPITLTSRINTKNAKDGDGVYGRTSFPITVNNKIVIPEGTHVRGKITDLKRGGKVKGKAELTLSFQSMVLPSGVTLEIYTSLRGAGGSGDRTGEATIRGDGSKSEDAKTVGQTAATGAVIGGIGNGGKGIGIGGGIGAAAGVATVLLTRGKDLILEPGTTIEVVLDQPLEPY